MLNHAIILSILIALSSCTEDVEDKPIRAYECKILCTSGEECRGADLSACARECEAYEHGESYCPGDPR